MSGRRVGLAALLLPLLALACCRSAGGQGSGDWKEKVEVSNKGSKSEGRAFSLLYRGKALPPVFDELVAAGSLYAFVTRPYLWGDSGYLKVEPPLLAEEGRARVAAAMTVMVDEEPLSEAELAAGFCEGMSRRPGTPGTWFWARRGDFSAFIDPKRVDAFLEAHPLSPLPLMALDTLLPAK